MKKRWFCGFEPKNSNIKKTLSFVHMTMKTWNVQYETFKRQFIKWTISGELPISLKSHQDSYFWSTRPLFLVGYYGRPCTFALLELLLEKKTIVWFMLLRPEIYPKHVIMLIQFDNTLFRVLFLSASAIHTWLCTQCILSDLALSPESWISDLLQTVCHHRENCIINVWDQSLASVLYHLKVFS